MSDKLQITVAGEGTVADKLLTDLVRHTYNQPQEEFCVPCIFRKHGSLGSLPSLDEGLDAALKNLPLPNDWKERVFLPKSAHTYYISIQDVAWRHQQQYQIAAVARADSLPDARVVILQPGAAYPFFIEPVAANQTAEDDSEALHLLLSRAFEESARANVALEQETEARNTAEARVHELESLLEQSEMRVGKLEETVSKQQEERGVCVGKHLAMPRCSNKLELQQRMRKAEAEAKLIVERESKRHAQAAKMLVGQTV